MKFCEVIDSLYMGALARRTSWDDDNIFVFMQVSSVIPAAVVPKMQSLPQAAKDYFQTQFDDEKAQINTITYVNQYAIVHKSNLIEGWSPSPADCLALDWVVLI